MTTVAAFTLILGLVVGAAFGAVVMGLCMAAKLGECDPEQFEHERDNERHLWRNNSAHRPHVQD